MLIKNLKAFNNLHLKLLKMQNKFIETLQSLIKRIPFFEFTNINNLVVVYLQNFNSDVNKLENYLIKRSKILKIILSIPLLIILLKISKLFYVVYQINSVKYLTIAFIIFLIAIPYYSFICISIIKGFEKMKFQIISKFKGFITNVASSQHRKIEYKNEIKNKSIEATLFSETITEKNYIDKLVLDIYLLSEVGIFNVFYEIKNRSVDMNNIEKAIVENVEVTNSVGKALSIKKSEVFKRVKIIVDIKNTIKNSSYDTSYQGLSKKIVEYKFILIEIISYYTKQNIFDKKVIKKMNKLLKLYNNFYFQNNMNRINKQ